MDKRITNFFCILVFTSASTNIHAANYWLGDADKDGTLTLSDLRIIFEAVKDDSIYSTRLDVNQDGKLSVGDIAVFISMLNGKTAPVWYREDVDDIEVEDKPGKFDLPQRKLSEENRN